MRKLLLVFLLFSSIVSCAQDDFYSIISSPSVRPSAPSYASLSNVALILDATGLVSNTDNTYGTLDANGLVSSWKSLTPGPIGRDFTLVGTAAAVRFDGNSVCFDGTGRLRNNTTANWNFLHYNATIGNLKWTVHAVVRMGYAEYKNWIYGLFGTTGNSQGSKGAALIYDDRISVPRTSSLISTISKGSAGYILDGIATSDVSAWHVITLETDMSQSASLRQRLLIDGVQVSYTVTSTSTAVVTTPTNGLDLGAAGGGGLPMFGAVSHFIVQSGIETSGVRDAFISTLIPHKNFNQAASQKVVDQTRTYSIYNTLAEAGRYYFVQGLIPSPINKNKVLKIYSRGDEHVYSADKKIVREISTDYGRTFGSAIDLYDPDGAGELAPSGSVWQYTSDGRLHGIVDVHTIIGSAGGTHTLNYVYSDDDGTTTTIVDITSIVPSDGLAAIRVFGSMIESNGYLYVCMYKGLEENAFLTESAQYILRKPVGSSTTWTVFTLRAKSSTYINETALVALDDNNILALSRNEVTKEWVQSIGTSNGSTWSAQVDCPFGESLTLGVPPALSSFEINGTRVIEALLCFKETAGVNRGFKTVYGKAADIIANGVSGWNQSTKTVLIADTQIVHYGFLYHYNNTFNAIGACVREPNPVTLTENTLISFEFPSGSYLTIKNALGL